MSIRTKIITRVLLILEELFFYPMLRKQFKNTLNNDSLILDVGANNGQSIDFFRTIAPKCKIVSFEPNPDLFTKLLDKYKNDKNLTLSNLGISNKSGFLEFNINKLDLTSSFEPLNYNSKYLIKKAAILGVSVQEIISKKINVPVSTLFDYLRENNISKVDLLKIDTEGHEYQCLESLFIPSENGLNTVIERIQIENHQDDMYLSAVSFDKIQQLLIDHNYIVESKIKHPFGNFFELIYKRSEA
jgi:FkbM family methyltransferase